MKKYKLPKEFAQKWVEALRSKKYKQGHSYLYSNGNYCCLGVAGSICKVEKLKMRNMEFLADVVIEEDVPTALLGYRVDSRLITELTDMNDSTRIDGSHMFQFPVIANWIESNIEFI